MNMNVSEFLLLASDALLIVALLLLVVMLARDKFLVDTSFSISPWVIYFIVLAYTCGCI